ncbi:unnamed protein product [Ilex paraguariensis]|uniref:Myb-like domain-containing protein n=1 Tax=Ilex paraguariensis TaxID=185542 RepID=A0ABC8SE04_9AQUA
MGEQYVTRDLRELMAGKRGFPAPSPASEPYRNLLPPPPQLYNSIMLGCHSGGLAEFGPNTNMTVSTNTSASVDICADSGMEGGCNSLNDGGRSRWPRQETLTLLEIRSRLDHHFKEANQKGPLWDEVSRLMMEEYGYQRSGRKCREKFENLYKYYKKTKEGKSGRQDGKNYRFFRQLEALYGETSHEASTDFIISQATHEPLEDEKLCESLKALNPSNSNPSEFETSSSENNGCDLSAIACMMKEKKKCNEDHSFGRVRKSWKADMEDFVGSRMRKLMETQEAWMEKMLKTIEHREQERTIREEEWRKQETARFDHEYQLWVNERSRFEEARNFMLMEALQKLAGEKSEMALSKELKAKENSEDKVNGMPICVTSSKAWLETEISSLIQLRTSMEPKFNEFGHSEDRLWEQIASKMARMGYDWSAARCKETWDNISIISNKMTRKSKKKCEDENSRNFQHLYSYSCQEFVTNCKEHETLGLQLNDYGRSTINSNMGNVEDDNFFHILMDGGGNLLGNYGGKFNKV